MGSLLLVVTILFLKSELSIRWNEPEEVVELLHASFFCSPLEHHGHAIMRALAMCVCVCRFVFVRVCARVFVCV